MGTPWWASFFDREYTDLWRVGGAFDRTAEEVEGILGLLPQRDGLRILDVPCGFGRHAAALHERGHAVTGLDLSTDQLALAAEHHPGPTYIHGDMRTPPDGPFDAVLNLFSSIGYFEDEAEDRRAIRAWHDRLAPGGTLLIETNHRDRLAKIYDPDAEIPIGPPAIGAAEYGAMDWDTGVMNRTVRMPDGTERSFHIRVYATTELLAVVRGAGFDDVEAFGDWSGNRTGPDGRLIIRARRGTDG
ncbi:class I SAM-dependent methyltransferase [Euzebya tangerina]|uniref:class I SAM-dependent methyltransferase n=1 Tax=Euzebya tangerina TaxID=591198 RepID=UPI000E30BCC8|nr:class I SAM-dependent methyltransferase [Euzebya tangerina]